MAVITDKLSDGAGNPPVRGRYTLSAPARSYEGATDVLGQWADDIPAGTWQLLEVDDQQSQISTVYVPNLEGPFRVADIISRRPLAGVEMYGPSGALHGMDALIQVSTEQTITTRTPGSWAWPAGITIGWTAFDPSSGLLWMAGWGMRGNSAFTTGTAYYLSSFDPRTGMLTHMKFATDQSSSLDVVGSNAVTGGAMGADVAVALVGGEYWVLSLATLPYNGFYPWHIPGVGSYPALGVARRQGGQWLIDASKGATTDVLHNSGAKGADAFPATTNSFGEAYYNSLLLSEIGMTPASNVAIIPQYASTNPNHPGQVGGSILAVDPLTKTVLAQWVSPFTGFADVSADTEYAGTAVSDGSPPGGSGTAWTLPGNAQGGPNDSYASAALTAGTQSEMLKGTNFGFAVPSNATIVGVVATLTRSGGSGLGLPIVDGHVWLVKAGVVQTGGTDQSTGSTWTANFVDKSLPAGTSDLWGTTLTYADVNDPGFGVAWQAKDTGITGSTAAVDALALTVYYTVPGVGKNAPRTPMVDPTGTLGNETFAVIYDTYDSQGGPNAYNTFQMFKYDHGAGTITPISDWLKPDAVADHWTCGGFDSSGWLVLSRRIRLSTVTWAVFPKVDGSWQPAQFPFAYSNTYPRTLTPDFTFDTVSMLANYSTLRPALDPITASIWFATTNYRAQGIRLEGDSHAPRITVLPPVASDTTTYISPNEAGAMLPAKPSIDPAGRTLFIPIAQWFKNSESWPQTPAPRNQYMMTTDLDRCGKGPQWAGPSTGDQMLAQPNVTPLLPPRWQPGQLVVYVFANSMTTDPAVEPITVTAGWTKQAEVRNGGAGLRYMVVTRIMQAGDVAPTFSWTGNKNLIYLVGAIIGADPTTPIDACVISPGPAGGTTSNYAASSVTPSVTGCRILHAYITQIANQVCAIADTEVTPGEIKRREIATAFNLSACLTEEEQLATTVPTRQRFAHVASTGLNAAFTIAVRPAAAAVDPPAVSTVACVPNPVAHGNTTVVTVTLASPATRDTVATVTASNSKATVPYTCKILSGASSGTVTANAITAGTVTISAKTVGATQNTVLTIT